MRVGVVNQDRCGVVAMPEPNARTSVSPQSFLCKSVIPSARFRSSREAGWTSLLVDVHSGISSNDPYDSIVTSDPRIGVTISGRYSADFYTRGRWRHDAHGPGSVNIHKTAEQTRYRFPVPEDQHFKMALIYYPLLQLDAAVDHLRRPGQSSQTPSFGSSVGRDPALTQITFALLAAMEQGAADFYAQGVATWLAVHMVMRYGDMARDDDRNIGDISDQRLARVIDYMSAHFAQPLTLEQLAAEACISKFHFNRLFTRKIGQSPHRYLANLRLDAAHRMLGSTGLTMAQVGVKCGYPSSSHFSAAFSRRFSMSPTECRNAARPEGDGW